MHFRDRGVRVCFLEYPIISLIIIAQHRFSLLEIFLLERSFYKYVTRLTFPFQILKLPPLSHLPVQGEGGKGRSSIFVSIDSFLKNIKYVIFFTLRSNMYYQNNLTGSTFFAHYVYFIWLNRYVTAKIQIPLFSYNHLILR